MYCSLLSLTTLLFLHFWGATHAWSSWWGKHGGSHHGGGGGNRHGPRPGPLSNEDGQPPNYLWSGLIFDSGDNDGNEWDGTNVDSDDVISTTADCLRGGASNTPTVLKGPKNTMRTTTSYWKNAWKSTTTSLSNAMETAKRRVSSVFKSKERREEEATMAKLRTTPIRAVTAPNSTVLPNDVVSIAAKRSGMIGRPLRIEAVQEMARDIKKWYSRKGYVLHAVTGATLQPDTATAELTVQEPRVSVQPVGITFCKEMIVDDDGSLVTYRQYREKHSLRKSFGHDKIDRSLLNTTYIQATGRTDPQRLARVLNITPGRPFQWDGKRWSAIARSGLFSRILRASPEPMSDGTVQLHILATEAPPRNLEYGISKSLYTGSWEGEVDFEHNNLFGGGESLELVVRRGTKDSEPSVRLQYSDDKFGLEGGYDVELFSDFIGDAEDEKDDESGDVNGVVRDQGDLLDRRGASVRLRNPFNPKWLPQSSASACIERTSTVSGYNEAIASTTLGIGPLRKELPLDARSNMSLKLTTGTRVTDDTQVEDKTATSGYRVKPYTSATATTRQLFPLLKSLENREPVSLALQHSMTASTFNLPRHEANAIGHSSTLRGYSMKANGSISSCLVGTTEIRVPVTLPTDKLRQDASLVIFGDWLFAKKKPSSPLFRKSCVGVGIRKSFQGLPVRYDLSLTQDGKIGAAFALGRDFDV